MATGIPHGTAAASGGPGESGGAGRLPRPGPVGGWTVGRVVTLVIGSVLASERVNPDGSAGVAVRADAGVSAPALARLAAEAG